MRIEKLPSFTFAYFILGTAQYAVSHLPSPFSPRLAPRDSNVLTLSTHKIHFQYRDCVFCISISIVAAAFTTLHYISYSVIDTHTKIFVGKIFLWSFFFAVLPSCRVCQLIISLSRHLIVLVVTFPGRFSFNYATLSTLHSKLFVHFFLLYFECVWIGTIVSSPAPDGESINQSVWARVKAQGSESARVKQRREWKSWSLNTLLDPESVHLSWTELQRKNKVFIAETQLSWWIDRIKLFYQDRGRQQVDFYSLLTHSFTYRNCASLSEVRAEPKRRNHT